VQPDTIQTAASYALTNQEISVIRDLISSHQQLFGVCSCPCIPHTIQ